MTPNDAYSDCMPTIQRRKPQIRLYFPDDSQQPDRFLAPKLRIQVQRGNRAMVQTLRAAALIRRMGW